MLKIFSNIEELNDFAAEKFVRIGNQAIEERGRFAVALAGGSTPKSLYRLLTTEKFANPIDWSKTFFFFGDERDVLPDDEQSNFRMANENFFAPLNINAENVFRWQTEIGDAPQIAAGYEEKIKNFFDLRENEFPRFDLILLGMGEDGHAASLFPDTEALHETRRIAIANPVEKLATERLTLTFPVINRARNVIFLVKGADKAATLKKVLEGDCAPEKYPSQNVKPENGELLWLVDRKAAAALKH